MGLQVHNQLEMTQKLYLSLQFYYHMLDPTHAVSPQPY